MAMNLGIERNLLLRATGAAGQPTGLENNSDIAVINRASASCSYLRRNPRNRGDKS